MNIDTITDKSRNLQGPLIEGNRASSPDASQSDGIGEQIDGRFQTTIAAARDALGEGAAPVLGKVRGFARDRPWAFGAVAAVLGIALINTLRGKR